MNNLYLIPVAFSLLCCLTTSWGRPWDPPATTIRHDELRSKPDYQLADVWDEVVSRVRRNPQVPVKGAPSFVSVDDPVVIAATKFAVGEKKDMKEPITVLSATRQVRKTFSRRVVFQGNERAPGARGDI